MAGSEAQAGFYYQNIVAAWYVLALIKFGSQLRAITLENPKRAKHIDDIIADRADGTSFIQVKWSEDDTAAFTLHNLVTADDASPPLIAQLARGFRQISSEGGWKEIILLSTKKAGTNRQPSRGFDKSLVEFLEEFHKPLIAQAGLLDLRKVPSFAEYEPILERLRSASGLTDLEELSHFLQCLRFRLNEPHRNTVAERVRARLARLGIEPAQYANLLDHIVQWSIEGRLIRKDDVLRALGLLDRFVDQLSYDFPVDSQGWVPTPDLFKALDSSLAALDRGFILVEGEPGSGKSTALAMYRAHRTDVLFGYYCFVPHDRTLGNERLQDHAFVHSLCIGLRNAFPDVEFPRPYEPHTRALLYDWLCVLSRQGRRVVFIVDGVDHVDRKTRQSLVADPLTTVLDSDVPSNVLIVLSSQYLSALPPRLREHVQSDVGRHIPMPRFVRTQVREFFQLRGVSVADENLDAAVETSGGVPIYLEYLAELLGGMTLYEQERFLGEVPSLRNQKIDSYHQYLWDAWSSDQEVVYVLAMLAVRDEFTTPEDLR